ncbi:uncharacterized protein B0I36DRAFT_63561 [Microdochium trichocladiopsis]|uniref:BTB domain-containing protein n=1 Tax=Microdochium trichocladiopsis TaxID=1682393 RepID=A0A9P9BXP7_9PEZI|nr:uncharacterized protein B0I36DRAFT_63561 [Microdochium trichocladiopsis]KAH7037258.1 hypothetical protein B0I36DRAFT_63561 [Microdochium trichocladiopsis]
MSSAYVEELLGSLKGLYDSADFSDLVVTCGEEKHNVHQAVVYPRAPKLRELHGGHGESKKHIDLSEDDPQAVRLLLYYLYHLDYPHIATGDEMNLSATTAPEEQIHTNGFQSHHPEQDSPPTATTDNKGSVLFVTAAASTDDPAGGVKLTSGVPEYSIEKEAFITNGSINGSPKEASDDVAVKLSKKARKKKQRSLTTASSSSLGAAEVVSPSLFTNGVTASTEAVNGNNNNVVTMSPGATNEPVAAGTHVINGQQPPHPDHANSNSNNNDIITTTATNTTTERAKPQSPSPNLTIHARVYALATKYTVAGLRSLSAHKFSADLHTHWSSADFLAATREAYTNTAREDRRLRDAVLDAIKAHQGELLGRADVREVIRGLELSFDLLMVLHGGGGGAGAAGGGASGGGSMGLPTAAVVGV